MTATPEKRGTTLHSAIAFVRAFTGYAGWNGIVAALLVAIGAVLEGVSVLLLIPILSVVVAPGGGEPWRVTVAEMLRMIGAVTPLAQLAVLMAAFVAVATLRAVLLYLRDTTLGRLQTGFIEELRNRVLRVLAAAPWHRIVSLRHANVTNLISGEIQRVASSAQFLIQGSVSVVLLIVQSILAFSLAPGFASIVIALLLVGGAVMLLTQRASRDLGEDVVRHSQALMGSASGFLGGLKAAAAQNGQARFVAEFEGIQSLLRGRQLKFQYRQARTRAGFGLVTAFAGAAVMLGGVAAGVSPVILIALVLIFGRMSAPAQQIQQSVANFFFGLPAFESVQNLQQELGDTSASTITPIAPPEGAIALDGVSFLHPGGGGVRSASVTIEPGSFVGIGGPSGAGKTTLVDVLIGLLVPQTGTMSVGGVALDEAHRAGWRDHIAYIPQDGFLFHDTIRRNLSLGDPAIDNEAIARALQLAGADALVAKLDRGLETIIGERGAMLSGGERQRISLARALIRTPRLLVLDEAANAIDAAGEAALLDRLASLDPRPTILMISHRAESMALCDRVIDVELGVVTG